MKSPSEPHRTFDAGQSSPPRKLTPKQREIRQRESKILDVAFPMIRRGGIGSVSIGGIAAAMNYTRGTIYNHFPHKEDILVSLAARAMRRRRRLFEYAASVRGRPGDPPRDRVAAIGLAAEVYVDRLPDDFAVEQIIRHDSVWQKSSDGRREVLMHCEAECTRMIGDIVAAAIGCGDLAVPAGVTAASMTGQITFGLWSLVYGGLVLEATSPSLTQSGIDEPRTAIRQNCHRLLDRFDWQPLYSARAYASLVRAVIPKLETFADGLARSDADPESDASQPADKSEGGSR